MLLAIFGESCTGKSTLANKLAPPLSAKIFTGKDYLRLAKDEATARSAFENLLKNAVTGENLIYVLSEPALLDLLPEGAFRILMTCDLELIKERFSHRMGGSLPAPVAAMLEKKHGCFDHIAYDCKFSCEEINLEKLLKQILGKEENQGC